MCYLLCAIAILSTSSVHFVCMLLVNTLMDYLFTDSKRV